jgi:SprT protein
MEPLAETVVANRIQALLAVAEGHWGRPFPKPVITYDLRGRTAGQAIFRQNRIRINRVLLENNFDAFIKQTVGHELAHLVCWKLYGPRAKAHGAEWKKVMGVLGLPPLRCHTFDTSKSVARRPLPTFPYACRCRVRQLTSIRHRRMLAKPGYYKCTQCQEALRPAA